MHAVPTGKEKPHALSLLASHRPRNVSWLQAGGLLFGDWGTSRLYVLGLALFFAGRSSFYLILTMSGLILAVGWAYTQICRIYPDGGGVYTAARHKSRTLAVIGALLLFADYTVTASLSALDAFHYFGLPLKHEVAHNPAASSTSGSNVQDAGNALDVHRQSGPSEADALLAPDSPGLWAIVAILLIGAFNLMGPKHTGAFAFFAAVGMMVITLGITAFALPQVPWHDLPNRIPSLRETLSQQPAHLWVAFVSIVLALSGVEAIANLTGVMRQPVARTARKAIWVVAGEVALFNVILAVAMLAILPLDRDAHLNDMLAFLSGHYLGRLGEWPVRVLGGLLLLSAANTAITDMISVQYLMARDAELPQPLARLNRFGVPWIPALVAAAVPAFVLLVSHDLERLAALYAIGVVGAVAINVTLCATHPRLRRLRRKGPMMALGLLLLAIWVTLAFTKLHALVFVCIIMAVGLSVRGLTRWLAQRRGPRPTLLQQAILEQLSPGALAAPKLLVGTYGSEELAPAALLEARRSGATLVVTFIREVALSFKYSDQEKRLSFDTDLAAQKTFSRYLDLAHQAGVPILPVYDSGPDAAELIAENAAVFACDRILIGTSRRGALYHLIKGHFQRRLESLLPPEIPVHVIESVPAELLDEEAPAVAISG
jgi:amino acid transporter/nucleotide-binding universal stress UspA family protein